MRSPLFLLALAGGAYALYRHLNPIHAASQGQRVTLNGNVWILRPGVGYTDVYVPEGAFSAFKEALVVRYSTDDKRVLTRARNAIATTAIADLGLTTA